MVIKKKKKKKKKILNGWGGEGGRGGGMRLVSEGKATNPGCTFIVGEFGLNSGHCEKFNLQCGSSGLDAI